MDAFQRRALSLLLGIVVLFQGQPVAALGLGALQTHSALNQPFYAEIELFEVDQNALDAVKASLASQSAFEQAGIERPHALTRLQFTPMMGPRGEPMIQVITREPIREPYLDLLVEVIWPDGRLVKEYAVLLDPPAVGGQRTPRAAPPRPSRATQSPLAAAAQASNAPPIEPESAASSDAQRPESADTANSEQPAASQPSAEVAAQIDLESVVVDVEIPAAAAELDFPLRYGPVRPGDGLIRIARRLTPPGATLEQTAMAIYRNSQGAFHNGDINELRIGAELVIPTAAELFALPPQAARAQYRSALAGRPVVATPLTDLDVRLSIATSEVSEIPVADSEAAEEVQVERDLPALAPASAPEVREIPIADSEAAEEVQVDLDLLDVAPEFDPGAAEALVPAPSPSQTDAVLETEMLLLREVSEANRQEATELRTRVKELEAQLDDIRRLLELRNAQLASLSMAEGQAADNVAEELAEAADRTGVATQPAPGDTNPEAISAAATSSDDATPDVGEEGSGLDPMTVIGGWRQAMPSWALPLLGVGLLMTLLGLMRYRRRQAPVVAAVDVDEAPRGRDAEEAPFSDDLRLDPEWPIAATAGATQASSVATHKESSVIISADQQEAAWQGEAIELDASAGDRAVETDGITQHGLLAPKSEVELAFGVAPEPTPALTREPETERGPDTESASGRNQEPGTGPTPDTEPAPVPKREPEIELEPEPKLELDPDPDPDLGPELDLELEPAPEPAPRSGKGSEALDGLAAADVYLTYGRYQDAERVLRETIAAVGESPELLYKLAETYLAAGDMVALAPLADRMRSAAEPTQDAERWARIEKALAGEVPELGSPVEETADVGRLAAEAPEVGAVVDDVDGEELFLDLDELEQVVESSPAQPSESPFALDQPAVGDRSVAEDQRRYELDLAALDALTSAEPSHAALPEPELRPFVSESSQSVEHQSAEHQSVEHVGDLELPTLADLPDADAAALVAAPAADQDAGDLGRTAVATEEGGDERWPIESDDGWDEVGLKLDLARAYLDMEDPDAASAILKEVVAEGRDEQRREAEALLAGLS